MELFCFFCVANTHNRNFRTKNPAILNPSFLFSMHFFFKWETYILREVKSPPLAHPARTQTLTGASHHDFKPPSGSEECVQRIQGTSLMKVIATGRMEGSWDKCEGAKSSQRLWRRAPAYTPPFEPTPSARTQNPSHPSPHIKNHAQTYDAKHGRKAGRKRCQGGVG